MAYSKVKKLLGISAVVICMGTVMFTFNGCAQKPAEEPTAVVQEVKAAEEEPDEGGNIANDIDLNQEEEKEVVQEHQITVSYLQCATEADELTMVGDEQGDYTVKDYKAPIFFDYMQELNYEYLYDSETGMLYVGDRVVSSNVEVVENEDGTTRLYVKDYEMESSIPVVKYVRTSETDVEARYIGTAPLDSNMISGITFVMDLDENGNYILTGMQGVFGEDITKLPVYEGTFKGWSLEQDAEPVFDAGDQIKIGDDMALLPYFEDNEYSKIANEDGTCVEGQLEEIDGKTVLRIIHVKHTKDGKTTTDYALSGLDAEKDNVKDNEGKDIDKEKVKKQQTDDEKEAEKKKAEEQKKKDEEAKKKAEEQKKKQDEAKKNSDNGNANKGGGSGSNPSNSDNSGNQGQSTNDPSQTANVFGVPTAGGYQEGCFCGITGE